MNKMFFEQTAGIFLILTALVMAGSQIGLAVKFRYPAILREQAEIILRDYRAGGGILKFFWAMYAASCIMLIPANIMLYMIIGASVSPFLLTASVFGIISAVFFILGISRWLLLADDFSNKFSAENRLRENYIYIFEAFHIYMGNTVGEILGSLFMGVWLGLFGLSVRKSLPDAVAFLSMICGLGVMTKVFEWTRFKFLAKINPFAMKLSALLLVIIGIVLTGVHG